MDEQYPQPVQMTSADVSIKKKSRWWIWLMVGIVILIVVCVGLYFMFRQQPEIIF